MWVCHGVSKIYMSIGSNLENAIATRGSLFSNKSAWWRASYDIFPLRKHSTTTRHIGSWTVFRNICAHVDLFFLDLLQWSQWNDFCIPQNKKPTALPASGHRNHHCNHHPLRAKYSIIYFWKSVEIWTNKLIRGFHPSQQIILSMVENKTNPFGMIFLQLSPCLPKSIPPAANTHQAKHLAAGLSWFSDMHSLNFITHSAIQNVVSLNQFLFKFCVPSY